MTQPSYAILRFEKIKSLSGLDRIVGHLERSAPTPNADAALLADNQWLAAPKGGVTIQNAVLARLPERRRKDAVLAMEALLTASPEFFRPGAAPDAGKWDKARMRQWANAADAWLKGRFGDRLVASVLHLDEATPHVQALIIPLDEKGRLNAKDMFNPFALRKMQTDYAKALEKLGIERGVRGSRANHISIQDFYGSVEESLEPPDLGVGDKLALAAGRLPDPIRELQAQAAAARLQKRQLDEARATIAILSRERDGAVTENERLRQEADRVRAMEINVVVQALGGEKGVNAGEWMLPSLGRITLNGDSGRRFICPETGKKGSGAIDLVKLETGYDFPQAVRFLSVATSPESVVAEVKAAVLDSAESTTRTVLAKAPELNDLAPALPDRRVDVSAPYHKSGMHLPTLQYLYKEGDLETAAYAGATVARFTLRDDAGKPCGYQLYGLGKPFETVVGAPGVFSIEVAGEPNSPETLFIASHPKEALAAESVLMSLRSKDLELEEFASRGPWRFVAKAGGAKDDFAPIARLVAARKNKGNIYCEIDDPSLRKAAARQIRRQAGKETPMFTESGLLTELGATNWAQLAEFFRRQFEMMIERVRDLVKRRKEKSEKEAAVGKANNVRAQKKNDRGPGIG